MAFLRNEARRERYEGIEYGLLGQRLSEAEQTLANLSPLIASGLEAKRSTPYVRSLFRFPDVFPDCPENELPHIKSGLGDVFYDDLRRTEGYKNLRRVSRDAGRPFTVRLLVATEGLFKSQLWGRTIAPIRPIHTNFFAIFGNEGVASERLMFENIHLAHDPEKLRDHMHGKYKDLTPLNPLS